MEDREELKKLIAETKDNTIFSILDHVSSSGMQRAIKFFVIVDNEPRIIDGYIERILGYKRSRKHDGLTVNGVGMDMGYHVVNSLSIALYCPLKYTHEGAYTLKHRWI